MTMGRTAQVLTVHGHSRNVKPHLKQVGTTKHGRKGIHGAHRLPAAAKRDAWKHKGQAGGQP